MKFEWSSKNSAYQNWKAGFDAWSDCTRNLANCELLPAQCWTLMAIDRCCSRNVPLNWQNFNINDDSSCVNDNAKDSLGGRRWPLVNPWVGAQSERNTRFFEFLLTICSRHIHTYNTGRTRQLKKPRYFQLRTKAVAWCQTELKIQTNRYSYSEFTLSDLRHASSFTDSSSQP